jgi:hypothetical protein
VRGFILLPGLAACVAEEVDGPRFLHELDGAFWRSPLPGEHRRYADGTVDVAGFPGQEAEIVGRLVRLIDGVEPAFARSAAVYLPVDRSLVGAALPDPAGTLRADAIVGLVDVDPRSDERRRRFPLIVGAVEGDGPYDPEHALGLLPVQGTPLRPDTTYAAYVRRGFTDGFGDPVGPDGPLADLLRGVRPAGWGAEAEVAWRDAAAALAAAGVSSEDLAALTVFHTADPTRQLRDARDVAASAPPALLAPPVHTETWGRFCVYEGRIDVPVLQQGTPPYTATGGGFGPSPAVRRREEARLFVTLPRAGGAEALPVVVFVRTGGGGDRPLIDRGPRDALGVEQPGTGLAGAFADAGYAAVQVDGPLGGLRNTTGGDEQFLIFNVANPDALRDNLRQSAVELALLPELLAELRLDGGACDGRQAGEVSLQTDRLALWGHSMGASIAPLLLPIEPRYDALLLSGAGGSWVMNVLYKRSPLEVRPIAALMLNEPAEALDLLHPALQLLQWGGEAADVPLSAADRAGRDLDVLMTQGIVDTYILPPIANAASLSLGLDLAGPPLDAGALPDLQALGPLLPLVGRREITLPAQGNVEGAGGPWTRVVVQRAEDGEQDGHEVAYELPEARRQLRCFLETRRSGVPVAVADGAEDVGCGP